MENLQTALVLLLLFCSLWPSATQPFCGLGTDDKNHYGSTHGELCYDSCDQRAETYNWCNTMQGWDYCSLSENMDYTNKKCKDNNPCAKQGKDFYWCWLKEGSWGYCGLVEPKMLLHWSTNNHVCTDECQYYGSGNYYWCHTANGWDYCSPDVDVTYNGKTCHSDDNCGLHNNDYNWCWTSESNYDYCGPIESAECSYITSQHRIRRSDREAEILICTKNDRGNRKITKFKAVQATNDITNDQNLREEAEIIIQKWKNDCLADRAKSNLITTNNLRIDLQQRIKRNNQYYYNLQIQINRQRRSGQSTTVSQIIVPYGIPERYIRRAFIESMNRQARVFVDVEDSTPNRC